MFEAVQDWLEEREMNAAFDQGVADGEAAVYTEELQAAYDIGYMFGHGDFEDQDD